MQDKPETKAKSLYDTDFFVWCNEQARLVRERRFDELDLENVAEELASMGRSDKRQIDNRLEVLIAHLLKWKFQPGARKPGWSATIYEQRRRISRIIDDSPSLIAYPAANARDAYPGARLLAAKDTGIDFTLFPEACPFTPEQILDPEFLPQEPDSYEQK